METLIKKILHEEDKITLNEPLEIGDFIKVIDIGYGEGIHWTRDIRDVEDLSVIGFKRPQLYELYEVIGKGQLNPTQEIVYTLLKPEHKKRHETVKGFREGNMMEPLLFPSVDMWLKVDENEILSEERKRPPHAPWMDLDVGDEVVVVHLDKENVERGGEEMPELYTSYIVISSYPYATKNYYKIVDKDFFDEAHENLWSPNIRWRNDFVKIIFQGFDDFILREKEN